MGGIKDRLVKLSDFYGVSLRKFEEMCGLLRGNISNMKADSAIGSDKLAKIVAACDGLSAQWLLTGRGPMFLPAGLMTPQEAAVQEREAGAERWNVYDASPAGAQAEACPQNPGEQQEEAWLVCNISCEDIPDEDCPPKSERKSGRQAGERRGRGQDGEGCGPGQGGYGRGGNIRTGGQDGNDGRLIRDLQRRMAEKDAVIISLQQQLIEAQAQLLANGKGRKK